MEQKISKKILIVNQKLAHFKYLRKSTKNSVNFLDVHIFKGIYVVF